MTLVECLAVYRLARLVTTDTIAEPARERIIEAAYMGAGRAELYRPTAVVYGWEHVVGQDADPPKLATLVTCRWCTSMWVALGVVFVARHLPGWGPMADALALSAVASLLARVEGD